MHFSNEALSLKYFNKAKQFTILYNTLFPLIELLKFRLEYINVVEQTHYIYKMWHICMGHISNE